MEHGSIMIAHHIRYHLAQRPLLTAAALIGALLALTAPPLHAQDEIDPWDAGWIADEEQARRGAARAVDVIVTGTGLEGQGATIIEAALAHGVNPAFALAMFEKEASFAAPDTRAYRNNNPGNIIATGACRGLAAGSACRGAYGEVSTDGRFGVYASMADGVGAYFRLLAREYGGLTLREIVIRYCPPADRCDVEAYLADVTAAAAEYRPLIEQAAQPVPAFEGMVFDDESTLFTKSGPDERWQETIAGVEHHVWWVANTEGEAENTGRWTLALPEAGEYELYVFLPPLHATSQRAVYTIYHAGETIGLVVDQAAHAGTWYRLGTFQFSASGAEYVELVDATGEPAGTTTVAFDAVGAIYREPGLIGKAWRAIRRTGGELLARAREELDRQAEAFRRQAEAWAEWRSEQARRSFDEEVDRLVENCLGVEVAAAFSLAALVLRRRRGR
ncbi:MAG: hypothetical protein Kow00124_29820 [Anaerolineae bacterium]